MNTYNQPKNIHEETPRGTGPERQGGGQEQDTVQEQLKTIGEQQVELSKLWSELFTNSEVKEPSTSAEIIFRNPIYFMNNARLGKLPEELQEKWNDLVDQCDEVTMTAAITPKEGSGGIGLEPIQRMVRDGNVKNDYNSRSPIANIMRQASELFAKSIKILPPQRAGDMSYYEGNVQGAKVWLKYEETKIQELRKLI